MGPVSGVKLRVSIGYTANVTLILAISNFKATFPPSRERCMVTCTERPYCFFVERRMACECQEYLVSYFVIGLKLIFLSYAG
jgi:hypothetical protein